MSSPSANTAACSFPKVPNQSTQIQHVDSKLLLLLFAVGVCLAAKEISILSSSHLKWCKARYSLWLGIPFGFTRHGEALIKREGDERAGRLSCDGGQLLNWATNKQAWMKTWETTTQASIQSFIQTYLIFNMILSQWFPTFLACDPFKQSNVSLWPHRRLYGLSEDMWVVQIKCNLHLIWRILKSLKQ